MHMLTITSADAQPALPRWHFSRAAVPLFLAASEKLTHISKSNLDETCGQFDCISSHLSTSKAVRGSRAVRAVDRL